MVNRSNDSAAQVAIVTGATGCLGSQLVLRLLLRGAPVYAVVRASDPVTGLKRVRHAIDAAADACGIAAVVDHTLLHALVGDLCDDELDRQIPAELGVATPELWHLAAAPHPADAALDRLLFAGALDSSA